MFFPKEMTSIELVVPEQDLIPVTRALAGRGVFHQTDSGYPGPEAGSDSARSRQEQAAAFAALERQILSTMQSLGIDEGAAPPASQTAMVEIDTAGPLAGRIADEVRRTAEKLEADRKRMEQLKGYLDQVEPLAGIDLDLSVLSKSRYVFSVLGIIPAVNLERLKTSLTRIPHVVLPLRQDRQQAVVWLAGTREHAETLSRAARSAYLNPLRLPPVREGSPSEVIRSLHVAIRRDRERLARRESAMARLRRTREQQLRAMLWRVRASRMLTDAMARYGQLRYTFIIVGWVPSDQWPDLSRRLKQISGKMLMEARVPKRSGGGESVPVSLDHRGVLRPFQQLVEMFARPRYNELDPTGMLAVTFPVLFGAMFGDVGHGLVLILLGALLRSRKVKALRGLAGLGGLIAICGAAGCVFGFLYGSVFGVETVLHPLWMRPIDNILQILSISIGAGVVLLSAGFVLNILNAGISRDWSRMFLDRNGLAGLTLYWSLVALAVAALSGKPPFPAAAPAAAAAGLVVMFSDALRRLAEGRRPLIEGGAGTYAIQVFFEMFDTLIGQLSNSLSFVRVGAFAVAHAGLSSVFFILAALVSPGRGAGWWIVVLIGNLFIVGFEGLIVAIQTMRLEYYELFSKFFLGGGMRYEPLTLLPPGKERSASPQ
jgi:V/A-type H+-transporting ATPase subunit I